MKRAVIAVTLLVSLSVGCAQDGETKGPVWGSMTKFFADPFLTKSPAYDGHKSRNSNQADGKGQEPLEWEVPSHGPALR
ncbi:hypothetical protein Pan216_54780 [Planctomycetes bacterium Pan216]|uniref:Uncharacterized protein n=1 Tax=Kolteria novifilia TaxID=2527975 RepID=A0A518BC75_9BACT|nr:hypothetical protein Pan216_54780 [Planctomycetes bacterium Pan216]